MDFSMISSLKVDELKDFLKARGLKISGRKEELVSRVFCAVENNVPVLKSVIEIENDLSKEYQNKLINEGEKLLDPLSLENDWINEDEGKNVGR